MSLKSVVLVLLLETFSVLLGRVRRVDGAGAGDVAEVAEVWDVLVAAVLARLDEGDGRDGIARAWGDGFVTALRGGWGGLVVAGFPVLLRGIFARGCGSSGGCGGADRADHVFRGCCVASLSPIRRVC